MRGGRPVNVAGERFVAETDLSDAEAADAERLGVIRGASQGDVHAANERDAREAAADEESERKREARRQKEGRHRELTRCEGLIERKQRELAELQLEAGSLRVELGL